MNKKQNLVIFANEQLTKDFELLKSGKFEEKQTYYSIFKAIQKIKENPICGVQIPIKLIPNSYIQKYRINNLWKLNLSNGWRLVYSLKGNDAMILSIILEWFNHKNYEKRFKYCFAM